MYLEIITQLTNLTNLITTKHHPELTQKILQLHYKNIFDSITSLTEFFESTSKVNFLKKIAHYFQKGPTQLWLDNYDIGKDLIKPHSKQQEAVKPIPKKNSKKMPTERHLLDNILDANFKLASYYLDTIIKYNIYEHESIPSYDDLLTPRELKFNHLNQT